MIIFLISLAYFANLADVRFADDWHDGRTSVLGVCAASVTSVISARAWNFSAPLRDISEYLENIFTRRAKAHRRAYRVAIVNILEYPSGIHFYEHFCLCAARRAPLPRLPNSVCSKITAFFLTSPFSAALRAPPPACFLPLADICVICGICEREKTTYKRIRTICVNTHPAYPARGTKGSGLA